MALIREIEGKWPRCKVVLLTGHNEFQYAHQAIRSPVVVDYLLKTEGMDQIRETVDRAFALVREKLEISHQRMLLKEKLPKVLSGLQRQMLKDIVHSPQGSPRPVQAAFDTLQLPFAAGRELLLTVLTLRIGENTRPTMIAG